MDNPRKAEPDPGSPQSKAVLRAAQKAVRRALADHKAAGNPIAIGKDGHVQWIPATEIVLPDETADPGVAG
jgi:hypothetical protein